LRVIVSDSHEKGVAMGSGLYGSDRLQVAAQTRKFAVFSWIPEASTKTSRTALGNGVQAAVTAGRDDQCDILAQNSNNGMLMNAERLVPFVHLICNSTGFLTVMQRRTGKWLPLG
jgi:hypothetical protein